MAGDGMGATDLVLRTQHLLDQTPWRGCLVAGCGCTDSRIVSARRARFHAYLAKARGETADRVIGPEPEWQLPR